MDYFSVIVLIIVVLTFASDKNVKSIENIAQYKEECDLYEEINTVKSSMRIVQLNIKQMTYENIMNISKNIEQEYLLIHNEKIEFAEQDVDKIIANYIASSKRTCGFNLMYKFESQNKKWNIKRIYLDTINYLSIFNKKDISTYGVIIFSKQDIASYKTERDFSNGIIAYAPSELTQVAYTENQIKPEDIKNMYLTQISKANISMILKILLLIAAGSLITTNLIIAIFNIANDIYSLVIALVIYYCYSYVIRYVYKPIGSGRLLASYLFPIYFLTYIVVAVITLFSKVIKRYA